MIPKNILLSNSFESFLVDILISLGWNNSYRPSLILQYWYIRGFNYQFWIKCLSLKRYSSFLKALKMTYPLFQERLSYKLFLSYTRYYFTSIQWLIIYSTYITILTSTHLVGLGSHPCSTPLTSVIPSRMSGQSGIHVPAHLSIYMSTNAIVLHGPLSGYSTKPKAM